MNSTINLWDYLLSPEAMIREVKSQGEIEFGGIKQLPQHDRTVKTPKYVEPENIYLIISSDTNGLNTGSFFVRRNAFMSAFIDLWHDPYLIRNEFTFNEQDGLAHLIISHPHVTKHVGIVNRSLINVYSNEYKENDFVVHFAGCRTSDKDCDILFQDFWNRRTIIDTEEGVPRLRR
ncbi:galactosyl transferase [Trichophaea hybrida]|nr:galactosyl transferase [Trichophaea hybrida]